jgi:hypothetical protein
MLNSSSSMLGDVARAYGYSASRYEFVLGVRICTGYAGDCGSLPQPINMIHGKVRLQMVLWTLGILIFIMIPSSVDDIIVSAVAIGPYQLIVVCCDEYFC